MATKKEVTISLLTMSILLTFVASMITVSYAVKPPKPPPPGLLEVLIDSTWTPVDKYDVYPGVTYSLRITNIPLPDGTLLQIKVSNEEWSDSRIRTVTGGMIDPFDWTCPDVKPSNTFVVQYRVLTPNGDKPDSYVPPGYKPGNVEVVGGLQHKGHLHVIPEFTFGTVTAILSLFSGLGAYMKLRKK